MLLGVLESSGRGGVRAREEGTGSFMYWFLADICKGLLLGAIYTLRLPACHQEVNREGLQAERHRC